MNITLKAAILTPEPERDMPNRYRLRGVTLNGAGIAVSRVILILMELGNTRPGNLGPSGYTPHRLIKSDLNGQWSISALTANRYTVIAYDNTGEYDPVIKGGLTPEPME